MKSFVSSNNDFEIAVCATNYNCAHALTSHLRSIFEALRKVRFEYAVVDNHSRDGSKELLEGWAERHQNVRFKSARCSMGTGRNLSVKMTTAPFLLIVDTDVIYDPRLGDFAKRCAERFPNQGVQAIYAGFFPRVVWDSVGGRRSLNTYEDVDFWWRLNERRLIHWLPTRLGTNLKEADSVGGYDPLSHRYSRSNRILRLVRREWDLWKTREYEGRDLPGLIGSKTVDLAIGERESSWVNPRPKPRLEDRIQVFGRYLFQIMRD